MKMWRNEDFDLLLQEAIRCDKQLKNTTWSDRDEKHVVKVFTRLTMEGKVRAAVRWISEKASRSVLHPSDLVSAKDEHGSTSQQSV